MVTDREQIEHEYESGDPDDTIQCVVHVQSGNLLTFDVETLDELIATLQEARDEIVGRDVPPSSPAAHADV